MFSTVHLGQDSGTASSMTSQASLQPFQIPKEDIDGWDFLGLSVSSEIFEKRVNQTLEGLHGDLDITDDILIHGVGRDEKEANADHDKNLRALL